MGKKKATVCKERGYHRWYDEKDDSLLVDSITENYDEMTMKATCSDCNAEWEGSGYWSVEED